MELYQEILLKGLERGDFRLTLSESTEEWLKGNVYQTLVQIRDIIRDDSLTDEECFMQIEEIVCALERLGSDGGIRHDFG